MIQMSNVFKYYRTRLGNKVILDNISINLNAGSSYALLGINGAGKSTTMRVLAGTEMPNSGHIRRTSTISWPLGFGAGMHPKMTGRENCYFVARIYGQNPKKVTRYVEEFSELGADMDEPFETYSSGMSQRLAFGISMAIDFECYLIDEVIAVGDARFQQRCADEFNKRRMRSDVIMISHSMDTLRQYCSRGIVLAHGMMHEFSNVEDAIELYKKLNE